MKKILLILLALFSVSLQAAEIPFKKGFNLAGWFQVSSASQIQLTRFSKEDFTKIKSMGIDHLRLPVPLHDLTLGDADHTIDPLLFTFLDQVIDWAEEVGLYLIIDNHSFDVNVSTAFSDLEILTSTWKQVADRYKNRSDYLCYEVLNEPHGIADLVWGVMQQSAIDAIRSADSTHTIVIGPAGWNSYNNLQLMLEYADDNLIYTFHFYEPFLYTHQGAGWTDPPLTIGGVPYPYDANRMPELPASLIGTWYSGSYASYPVQGTKEYLAEQLDIAAAFADQNNISLWCGEFGAYLPNSTTEDRVRWLKDMHDLFEERNMSWAMWEFDGGFGVFEQGGNNMLDYDLNVPIIEALGLTPIPQQEFIIKPDSSNILIFEDFIGNGFIENSSPGSGTINFYDSNNPREGQYCMRFSDASQYGNIGLRLRPIKDLSYLVEQGYRLDLWLRSSDPDLTFDIRFIDTKTDVPEDHPWRMRYTVDGNKVIFDGNWQHLIIPLNSFSEHGSWDNEQWFEPVGDFDWRQIELFEIVAEHGSLEGTDIYFDQIRITDPATSIHKGRMRPTGFHLNNNYPNPFNPATTIEYTIGTPGASSVKVTLEIYNVLGQKVATLVSEEQKAGTYKETWDASGLTSAVYYYKISAGDFIQTRKMLLLR